MLFLIRMRSLLCLFFLRLFLSSFYKSFFFLNMEICRLTTTYLIEILLLEVL